jgi:hypothetical protein
MTSPEEQGKMSDEQLELIRSIATLQESSLPLLDESIEHLNRPVYRDALIGRERSRTEADLMSILRSEQSIEDYLNEAIKHRKDKRRAIPVEMGKLIDLLDDKILAAHIEKDVLDGFLDSGDLPDLVAHEVSINGDEFTLHSILERTADSIDRTLNPDQQPGVVRSHLDAVSQLDNFDKFPAQHEFVRKIAFYGASNAEARMEGMAKKAIWLDETYELPRSSRAVLASNRARARTIDRLT